MIIILLICAKHATYYNKTLEVKLSLIPLDVNQKEIALDVRLNIDNMSIKAPGYIREELLSAIKSGVESACVQGIHIILLCMYVYIVHRIVNGCPFYIIGLQSYRACFIFSYVFVECYT